MNKRRIALIFSTIFILLIILEIGVLMLTKLNKAETISYAQITLLRKINNYLTLINRDSKMADMGKNEANLNLYIKLYGFSAAMENLKSESGTKVTIKCHSMAHRIGRQAYKIFKQEAFLEKNYEWCHAGYIHGIMEELIRESQKKDVWVVIDEECSSMEKKFEIRQCFHGAGHGLMAYQNYNLKSALDLCTLFAKGSPQEMCFSGVFMENIAAAKGHGITGHGTEWLNKDPHYPCDLMKNKAMLSACYLVQTTWMVDLYNFDLSKIPAECLKAPSEMRVFCFNSLGRDLVDMDSNNKYIAEICSMGIDIELVESCIQGSLSHKITLFGQELKGQAADICKSIEDKIKSHCYDFLIMRLGDVWSKEIRIEKVCQYFERYYQEICKKSYR